MFEKGGEPGRGEIEALAALDAVEGDGAQDVAVLLQGAEDLHKCDFHWNYPMDFRWHFSTEFHLCDFLFLCITFAISPRRAP